MKVLISAEKIHERIEKMGEELSKVHSNDKAPLVVIGVLKGSFIFMADLVRALKVRCEIDFIEVSSYAGTTTTGEVKLKRDVGLDIRGRQVLLVEDIVDTGITIDFLRAHLNAKGPASLELAALLHKPAREVKKTSIEHLGFKIEDKFVVGYGLDFNGLYRELKDIVIFQE